MPKQAKSSSPSSRPVSGTDSGSAGFAGLAASADNPPFNLANHFLIAMPCMSDSVFNRSVVYLCEHHAGGALGVIINKPTDVSVDALFERLELRLEINVQDGLRPQSPVDLVEVVRHCADGLTPVAQENAISILIEAPDQLVVAGNRDELTRVAENLIENAIKYGASDTGEESHVDVVISLVRMGEGRDVARLCVRDHGAGIAAEHLPRLTERFYRVDAGKSRAKGGTGLGLALVKHIVARHRGLLRVSSRPGEGAEFTVELPLDV